MCERRSSLFSCHSVPCLGWTGIEIYMYIYVYLSTFVSRVNPIGDSRQPLQMVGRSVASAREVRSSLFSCHSVPCLGWRTGLLIYNLYLYLSISNIYIYIHVYIYIFTYLGIYTYVYVYMYVCIYIYIYTYTYIYMCVYTRIHILAVSIYRWMDVCI